MGNEQYRLDLSTDQSQIFNRHLGPVRIIQVNLNRKLYMPALNELKNNNCTKDQESINAKIENKLVQQQLRIVKTIFPIDSFNYNQIIQRLKVRIMFPQKHTLKIKKLVQVPNKGICNSTSNIQISFQAFSSTFGQFIKNQIQQSIYIQQEKALIILLIVSQAIIKFYDSGYKIPMLDTEAILFSKPLPFQFNIQDYINNKQTEQELVKIIDTDIGSSYNTQNITKETQTSNQSDINGIFLAPELIKLLENQNMRQIVSTKSDMFSLGMMLLSLLSLKRLQSLYNYNQKSFNYYDLQQLINLLPYSPELKQILSQMLQYQPSNRIGFISLQEKLNILIKKVKPYKFFKNNSLSSNYQTKLIQNINDHQKMFIDPETKSRASLRSSKSSCNIHEPIKLSSSRKSIKSLKKCSSTISFHRNISLHINISQNLKNTTLSQNKKAQITQFTYEEQSNVLQNDVNKQKELLTTQNIKEEMQKHNLDNKQGQKIYNPKLTQSKYKNILKERKQKRVESNSKNTFQTHKLVRLQKQQQQNNSFGKKSLKHNQDVQISKAQTLQQSINSNTKEWLKNKLIKNKNVSNITKNTEKQKDNNKKCNQNKQTLLNNNISHNKKLKQYSQSSKKQIPNVNICLSDLKINPVVNQNQKLKAKSQIKKKIINKTSITAKNQTKISKQSLQRNNILDCQSIPTSDYNYLREQHQTSYNFNKGNKIVEIDLSKVNSKIQSIKQQQQKQIERLFDSQKQNNINFQNIKKSARLSNKLKKFQNLQIKICESNQYVQKSKHTLVQFVSPQFQSQSIQFDPYITAQFTNKQLSAINKKTENTQQQLIYEKSMSKPFQQIQIQAGQIFRKQRQVYSFGEKMNKPNFIVNKIKDPKTSLNQIQQVSMIQLELPAILNNQNEICFDDNCKSYQEQMEQFNNQSNDQLNLKQSNYECNFNQNSLNESSILNSQNNFQDYKLQQSSLQIKKYKLSSSFTLKNQLSSQLNHIACISILNTSDIYDGFQKQNFQMLQNQEDKLKSSSVNQQTSKLTFRNIQLNDNLFYQGSLNEFGLMEGTGILYQITQKQQTQNDQYLHDSRMKYVSQLKTRQDIYSGTFTNNQYHGFGTLYYNGTQSNSQKLQISNQDKNVNEFDLNNKIAIKYDGQFQMGKQHGFGTYIYTNGQKFSGNIQYGTIQGYGCFYGKQQIKSGVWKQGVFVQQNI